MFGRTKELTCNVLPAKLPQRYALPADSEEHGRLDIQHEMLKRKRNGLFFAQQAVRRALAPREGVERAALDVGSGSGSWVFDMAKQFPHVDFLGIDLAPANLNMCVSPSALGPPRNRWLTKLPEFRHPTNQDTSTELPIRMRRREPRHNALQKLLRCNSHELHHTGDRELPKADGRGGRVP